MAIGLGDRCKLASATRHALDDLFDLSLAIAAWGGKRGTTWRRIWATRSTRHSGPAPSHGSSLTAASLPTSARGTPWRGSTMSGGFTVVRPLILLLHATLLWVEYHSLVAVACARRAIDFWRRSRARFSRRSDLANGLNGRSCKRRSGISTSEILPDRKPIRGGAETARSAPRPSLRPIYSWVRARRFFDWEGCTVTQDFYSEQTPAARIRRSRETLAALSRLRRVPSPESAAQLHELHARHMRELGDEEAASRADERALRAWGGTSGFC
jgi:hypothetical protein